MSNMAAPRAARSESDSSSEEDQERFREAVWSFGTNGTNGVPKPGPTERGDGDQRAGVSLQRPSRRVRTGDHEHDGNELQTTPEFRAHVAKKLGSVLDSVLTEVSDTRIHAHAPALDCEDGFLLFSTSVPGQSAEAPPHRTPRRPTPSSSESDSELDSRVRQAAVSVSDILRHSACPSMHLSVPPCTQEEKEKKKKRRRENEMVEEGEGVSEECATEGTVGGETDTGKRKRKKKKMMMVKE
ncbi:protein CUSTOS [Amia ocellicauda]|uniref:protein CUSTOS n=1 Tax=Amia ocellicauda TaxID=2972642 RepID=UPI003463FF2D